jgi:hypothetical protein
MQLFFLEHCKMGFGVVARDYNGVCLAASSEPILGVQTPELAEAMALRRAVSLARDEGYTAVIFASDCLSPVQSIKSSTIDRSSVASMAADIKHAASGFSSVEFCHVTRTMNVAAHVLAKSCVNSGRLCVFHSALDCIKETMY